MRLYYKILCIIIISIYCLPGYVFAQQSLTINGIIFKKNASERISQALITNQNSQVVMMSDELGGFSIKATLGDTLLITKANYTSQKRAVNNADDLVIYMQPVVNLNEVTIKGQTKKQELNEVMGQYHSQGTFYNGSPPLWSFINSPLTGLYELFGKTPQRAKRFAAFSKNELEYNEVNRRYTKELVKKVTNLPDEEVPKFMEAFTPSFDDLKEWNDYRLIMYIKKSLAYYQKTKEQPQPKKLY